MPDFTISRTPGRAGRRPALLLCVAFALSSSVAIAQNATWSRYFPDRATAPENDTAWAELAHSFPNRVKPAAIAATPATQPPAATRVEVRPGIDYLRVRSLANDLPSIEAALERSRLIIDLRYVRSELAEALPFGALLAGQPFTVALGTIDRTVPPPPEPRHIRAAGQITLCLVNRATAGPLEAVLDALQNAGDILLVGTQTAGDTGVFDAPTGVPAWRVIQDDYRRAGGPSLLDVGVTPGLFVETVPDTEDAAYVAFDASRPIADLLDAPVQKSRFDEARLLERFHERNPHAVGAPTASPAAPSTTDTDDDDEAGADADESEAPTAQKNGPVPFDRTLQRAVGTLVAFDVLHRPSK